MYSDEKVCEPLQKLLTEELEELASLRDELNSFRLLPGLDFDLVYNVNWVTLNGTKYCKGSLVAASVTVTRQNRLPHFGAIKQIYIVGDYVYFGLALIETSHFEYNLQAYRVEGRSEKYSIIAYESLVDYNVFHKVLHSDGSVYAPVKYDLTDIMIEHLQGANPLF